MKMPFASGLNAHDGSVFTVVCTVGFDDADIVEAMILYEVAQRFADFFAAAFFTFLSCANVKDFGWCMFFLAHAYG